VIGLELGSVWRRLGAQTTILEALPALLPFLKIEFGLSYTLVAVLVLASALSSSIVQPLFGLWSDARGAIWLLPAGVAVAGAGMAAAADAPSYWLVVVLVIVSGLGTPAYHPEGSKFAAYTSGRKRASGMSLFAVGGNVGYGLGALVVTPIIVAVGLRGGWFLVVPGAVVAVLLLAATRYLLSFVTAGGDRVERRAERPALARDPAGRDHVPQPRRSGSSRSALRGCRAT
jgi:FSR family fosmidomycin resistance protein-like MFS transporter